MPTTTRVRRNHGANTHAEHQRHLWMFAREITPPCTSHALGWLYGASVKYSRACRVTVGSEARGTDLVSKRDRMVIAFMNRWAGHTLLRPRLLTMRISSIFAIKNIPLCVLCSIIL